MQVLGGCAECSPHQKGEYEARDVVSFLPACLPACLPTYLPVAGKSGRIVTAGSSSAKIHSRSSESRPSYQEAVMVELKEHCRTDLASDDLYLQKKIRIDND